MQGTEPSKEFTLVLFNMFYGNFVCKAPDPNHPDAKKRVNKLGDTVYELSFGSLFGKLVEIKWGESEYGHYLRIRLQQPDETIYSIRIPMDGPQARTILRRIPNINPAAPLKLSLFKKKEDGKDKYIMSVYNEAPMWEKDNERWENISDAFPGWKGMPELKRVTVNNKKVWDNTDRMRALLKVLKEFCVLNLGQDSIKVKDKNSDEDSSYIEQPETAADIAKEEPKKDTPPIDQAPPPTEEPNYLGEDEEDDDLPF